jgi:hypothetical protein
MDAVSLTTAFDIVFAAGVAVALLAVAGAATRRLTSSALTAIAGLELAGSAAAWIVFAVRRSHDSELAIAAGGILGCALAAAAAVLVRRTLSRVEAIDAQLDDAQGHLRSLVAQETSDRAEELERALARARADSVSLLAEEERKLAEAHRREFADRDREAGAALTAALTTTQAQVEKRLAGWSQDLDRVADAMKGHIAELAQRQKQLVSEAELRIAADADRLAAESEELRAAVQRVRVELDKALGESLAAARTELDGHAAERRRALHELDDRMRRRERELLERIEREETEAGQRIRIGFEDVQRKQVEQLQRVVERAAGAYSDEAAQLFAGAVKSSREEAARRLSRELDRAVEVFAREAESVLAERLAHVGDAGAQRLERRLADATGILEQERETRLGELETRIAEFEAGLRRRLEEIAADADAERAVVEARVQELLRRLESASSLQRTS